MKMKLTAIAIAILAALFILSFSIALPILFRPFYYMQIEAFGLSEDTGLSIDEIKLASRRYAKRQLTWFRHKEAVRIFRDSEDGRMKNADDFVNEMMDYCLGLRSDFSAGPLPFSEEGASHFYDVRVLFLIDLAVLLVSSLSLIAILIILKVKKLTPYRFLGRSAPFWSVSAILGASSVIGIACAIDFDTTFDIFHHIFFIGKTNWAFKPSKDPIINLLPAEFFLNCAIFIGASVLLLSAAVLIFEFIPRKRLDII